MMLRFDEAMTLILHRHMVRRKDWNRPHHVGMEHFTGLGDQIVMVMKDGTLGAWSPSQCDMKARDWEQVK